MSYESFGSLLNEAVQCVLEALLSSRPQMYVLDAIVERRPTGPRPSLPLSLAAAIASSDASPTPENVMDLGECCTMLYCIIKNGLDLRKIVWASEKVV